MADSLARPRYRRRWARGCDHYGSARRPAARNPPQSGCSLGGEGHVRPSFQEGRKGVSRRRRSCGCGGGHRFLRVLIWKKLQRRGRHLRKKSGHGGHHGGAWKVAYADFVTAMMALFIVLWLFNSSKQVQQAASGYFKDASGKSKKVGTSLIGSGENFSL
jgi:Membrane MotB of proton-channel complex MotA/MotB